MQQQYIINNGSRRLLLFFAGWGMDAVPFADYRPTGCDFMVCYDYGDDRFDAALLGAYDEVCVVGWSMGVWMAAHLLTAAGITVGRAIAINGTMHPVDGERGIAPEIFRGTLDGLSEATLMKFRRRMCGGGAGYKSFMERAPQRDLESLRTELAAIGRMYAEGDGSANAMRWDEAVVGDADAIFPTPAQQRAWSEAGVAVTEVSAPHYKEEIFRHYLEEIWTND
jgi:biotin synthesis protein BioG